MPESLLQWISGHGLPALFVLLMLGVFGLPVPDETLLTFTGVLVGQGHVGFFAAWLVATLGSIAGITLSYLLGRTAGQLVITRYGAWLHIHPGQVARVEAWMEHSGQLALAFGYFVPGVRHLTALVAGSSGLPPRKFATAAYSGAALWSLTFISLGWYFGERWRTVLASLDEHVLSASLVLAGLIAGYLIVRAVRRRQ